MRTAETAFDMLRNSKIAARNPFTHFMSLPSGSSKLIGSLCVMREAATVLIQVHGFVWALCSACPAELPEVRRAPTMFRPCRRVGKWGRRDVCCWQILLQKSFWGDERTFSGTLTRVARDDVKDQVVPRKNSHGRQSGNSADVWPDRQNAINGSRWFSQSLRISSLMKAVRSVPTPSPRQKPAKAYRIIQ